MPYYDALIAKWATLKGTTDEKLTQINALAVPGPDRAVPIDEITALWWRQGVWPIIKVSASTSAGAAAALAINSDTRMQTIDMNIPIVGQMLGEMVSKSVITQAQADDVIALKNTTLPWWQGTVAQGGGELRASVALSDLAAAGGLS